MEKDLIKIIKSSFKNINKRQLELLKKNKIKISEISNYDSLNFMKFIFELESKFKIKVNHSNLNKFKEYKKIFQYVNSLNKKKLKK